MLESDYKLPFKDRTCSLLYKCPEEHRFQAAGNERKKERILIERMKERKKEKEKGRKKERREKERKKEKSRQTAG